jgi:hypothetical protein
MVEKSPEKGGSFTARLRLKAMGTQALPLRGIPAINRRITAKTRLCVSQRCQPGDFIS